ncbi:MAG: pilus assembly protein N-terminal domain-containing protein [Planctomycetales bacterium]|nr:pilus assembly protein N-terminal domain-containing protein [Planctomycetales bacterium]
MLTNSSRILTLDHPIPYVQVNNQNVVKATPLDPQRIQIFAQSTGIAQVNLWDENNQIHTVDVIVTGDGRELEMILEAQFPNASLTVSPLENSVIIGGYVTHAEHVNKVVEIASDYYPKVINNVELAGVQQVLLQVKVMEVSRTKLRNLGVDLDFIFGDDTFATSIAGRDKNILLNVIDGNTDLLFEIEALRQDNLLKMLSEPKLLTVSGRPARFIVGGEVPILVPQSLGTVSIQFKEFGTQLDFVPIVLGNARIRLEVRPRVSQIDETLAVSLNNITTPGFRVREIETGAELQAGQTLALGGLIEHRVEAETRKIPLLGEIPYAGALFRRVHEKVNEVELLVLVTPQLVEAMDPHEVPQGGPGDGTCSPTDHELYLRGHIEVPCGMGNCGQCGKKHLRTGGYPNPYMDTDHPGMYTPPGENGTIEQVVPGSEVIDSEARSSDVIAPTPYFGASVDRDADAMSLGGEATATDAGALMRPASARRSESRNPAASSPVIQGNQFKAPHWDGADQASADNRYAQPVASGGDELPRLLGPVGYDVDN